MNNKKIIKMFIDYTPLPAHAEQLAYSEAIKGHTQAEKYTYKKSFSTPEFDKTDIEYSDLRVAISDSDYEVLKREYNLLPGGIAKMRSDFSDIDLKSVKKHTKDNQKWKQ